jgi:hypothetical protein
VSSEDAWAIETDGLTKRSDGDRCDPCRVLASRTGGGMDAVADPFAAKVGETS